MGRRPSAVATLVERASRFVMLVALPAGMKALAVRAARVHAFGSVTQPMLKSLTWDRGREMADHRAFTEQTACPVYFCDARSPWQRGTNENTNGLLRQYLDKNGDISVHDQTALDQIAAQLNGRPREVLDWRTASEVFEEMAASAT